MKQFFSYWFWPNPAGWYYTDTRVQIILAVCVAIVVASFLVRLWRRTLVNPMTRTLTAGWPTALFWFGIVAVVLAVSRVETIQFVEMRALWVVWAVAVALYVFFQCLQWKRRHYVVLGRTQVLDERDKYLPRKKR